MSLPISIEALSEWMDSIGLDKGDITDAEVLAGGTQNILIKFSRAGQSFVLRRPPLHLRKNSNKTMLREAKVLEALSGTDVPHPKFIAMCDDESVLGACFYLMAPIEGFNATVMLPELHASDANIRRQMGFSYVEGIAALGQVDYKAIGLEDFGKAEGYLERQPSRWMSQLESYSAVDQWPGLKTLPDPERIFNWLERNMPSDYEVGVIHGDCHVANVMFDYKSSEMNAIVDWELSTIGDPLIDLGWVVATWPDGQFTVTAPKVSWDGFPKIDELIKHYGAHTHRSLEAIDWYAVMSCFKLGAILEGTHARACAGKAPMKVGEQLHIATRELFERATKMLS